MHSMFIQIALLLYLTSAVLFWLYIANKSDRLLSSSLALCVAGFLLHTASIIARTLAGSYFPLTKLHESLIFFCWGLMAAFLLGGIRYKLQALGPFVMTMVSIVLASSMLLPHAVTPFEPLLESNWFVLHTVTTVTGFVFFAVACLIGVTYLIQDRLLKKKRLTALFHKLPPLDVLDKINQFSISVGFLSITTGLVAGFVWSYSLWGRLWNNDPKLCFAMFTWLFYLIAIHGRFNSGWRSKKAAYVSVIGFIAVVILFLFTTLCTGDRWHVF